MRDIVAVLARLNDNFQSHRRNVLLLLAVFKQRLQSNRLSMEKAGYAMSQKMHGAQSNGAASARQ
jgi:hypothetical protein